MLYRRYVFGIKTKHTFYRIIVQAQVKAKANFIKARVFSRYFKMVAGGTLLIYLNID